MQTGYCDENSVCLSVCPSVTRPNCDKTVERSVQIYIPRATAALRAAVARLASGCCSAHMYRSAELST